MCVAKSRATTKTSLKRSIFVMLRKQRQWNYIKFPTKITRGRKKKKKAKNKGNKQKRIINMVDINSSISLTTLNINVLMNQFKKRANSLEKILLL